MNACAFCGCTDVAPCVDPFDGEPHPCFWIAPEICSACRFTPIGIRAPALHERVLSFMGGVAIE